MKVEAISFLAIDSSHLIILKKLRPNHFLKQALKGVIKS